MDGQGFTFKLVATAAVGGAASVAGGGKFENGAVTAAYGYLFNQAVEALRDMPASPPGVDINGNIDEALRHKGMSSGSTTRLRTRGPSIPSASCT